MKDLGLIYGSPERVDARFPWLGRTNPMYGVYLDDRELPVKIFDRVEDAAKWAATAEARALGADLDIRAWHPRC